MRIRRMLIACWITKATNTHSQYVILIAIPLQQWLQERASMLRYTYIACLVMHYLFEVLMRRFKLYKYLYLCLFLLFILSMNDSCPHKI
jgi:hypothetical protein